MRNDDEKDLHVLMAFEIRLSTKRSVYVCVFSYCISWSSSMSTMNFLISVLLHLLLVEWQSKCGGTHAAVELGSVCTRKTNGSRRAFRRTDGRGTGVRTVMSGHNMRQTYYALRVFISSPFTATLDCWNHGHVPSTWIKRNVADRLTVDVAVPVALKW